MREAVSEFRPDALLVDTNSWGAQTVAEASGVPWAVFQPYFTPLPARGVPPFGPGFRRADSLLGRARDSASIRSAEWSSFWAGHMGAAGGRTALARDNRSTDRPGHVFN